FSLIPQKFTLSQLQRVYEVVLSQRFDKRNFRKRLRSLKLVKELDEFQDNVPHRAARLYRLNPREAHYGDQLI
ncbi:MAG: NUDIX hydrolase, partial [Verrucomicrobiales bacterium]